MLNFVEKHQSSYVLEGEVEVMKESRFNVFPRQETGWAEGVKDKDHNSDEMYFNSVGS
jgi:hypothetical protein